jgi:hypothetical protein
MKRKEPSAQDVFDALSPGCENFESFFEEDEDGGGNCTAPEGEVIGFCQLCDCPLFNRRSK